MPPVTRPKWLKVRKLKFPNQCLCWKSFELVRMSRQLPSVHVGYIARRSVESQCRSQPSQPSVSSTKLPCIPAASPLHTCVPRPVSTLCYRLRHEQLLQIQEHEADCQRSLWSSVPRQHARRRSACIEKDWCHKATSRRSRGCAAGGRDYG